MAGEKIKKRLLRGYSRNICQAEGKYFDQLTHSCKLVCLICFFWDNVRPSKHRKKKKEKEMKAESFSLGSPGADGS